MVRHISFNAIGMSDKAPYFYTYNLNDIRTIRSVRRGYPGEYTLSLEFNGDDPVILDFKITQSEVIDLIKGQLEPIIEREGNWLMSLEWTPNATRHPLPIIPRDPQGNKLTQCSECPGYFQHLNKDGMCYQCHCNSGGKHDEWQA